MYYQRADTIGEPRKSFQCRRARHSETDIVSTLQNCVHPVNCTRDLIDYLVISIRAAVITRKMKRVLDVLLRYLANEGRNALMMSALYGFTYALIEDEKWMQHTLQRDKSPVAGRR